MPDWLISTALLSVGVGLLLGGAELFTESAVDSARALRVTTLAIGLLVAGAEPEELFTAAIAAFQSAPGIAVGDAIGTNVTIVGLALGLGAVLAPPAVPPVAQRHGLITLAVSTPAVVLLSGGGIGRFEGILLCLLYGGYVWYVVRRERIPLETEKRTLEELAEELAEPPERPLWQSGGWVLAALVLMAIGGRLVVQGALGLAAWSGLGEGVVGLTLVALATSAEMLVLAVVPTLRGHSELTIGGILGSYAYNMTLTLGGAAVVAPLASVGMALPLAFMVGSLVLLLLMLRQTRLGRAGGLLLLGIYGAYLVATFRS